MNEPTLNAVMQRLDHLERQNRWWKLLAGTMLTVLGCTVLLGAVAKKAGGIAKEIRAERFLMVTKEGDTLADLYVDDLGRTRLDLQDKDRQGSVEVGAGTSRAYVSVAHKRNHAHSALSASADGTATLAVGRGTPEALENNAIISTASDGRVLLRLHDKDNKARFSLDLDAEKTLDLQIGNEQEIVQALIQLERNGDPKLIFSDGDGNTRVVLGSHALKYPTTGSVEKRPVSSLMLFNKNGEVLWSVP
jgi:hypothetical protein